MAAKKLANPNLKTPFDNAVFKPSGVSMPGGKSVAGKNGKK
jgi:hypothetical protein